MSSSVRGSSSRAGATGPTKRTGGGWEKNHQPKKRRWGMGRGGDGRGCWRTTLFCTHLCVDQRETPQPTPPTTCVCPNINKGGTSWFFIMRPLYTYIEDGLTEFGVKYCFDCCSTDIYLCAIEIIWCTSYTDRAERSFLKLLLFCSAPPSLFYRLVVCNKHASVWFPHDDIIARFGRTCLMYSRKNSACLVYENETTIDCIVYLSYEINRKHYRWPRRLSCGKTIQIFKRN